MNIKPQIPIHLGNTPHGIAYRVFCDDDNYGDVVVKITFVSKDSDKGAYKQRFDTSAPFTDHHVPKEIIPRKATLIFISYSLRNSEGRSDYSDELLVYNPFIDNPHPWEGNLEYTAKMLEGDIEFPHLYKLKDVNSNFLSTCQSCITAFEQQTRYQVQKAALITQQEPTHDTYYL